MRSGLPATRHIKGIATAVVIGEDPGQMYLPFEGSEEAISEEIRLGLGYTWILLYYPDELTGMIRVEFSRPHETAPRQRVDRWHERVLLSPIDVAELDAE